MSGFVDMKAGAGGVGFRIAHVWAVLAVHGDQNEGIVHPDGRRELG